MDSKSAYAKAYVSHYKHKDYRTAFNQYLEVIGKFPNTPEHGYAMTQIENLEKSNPGQCEPDESNLPIFEEIKTKREASAVAEKASIYSAQKAIEKRNAKQKELNERSANMLLSTCGSLEGYRVIDHLGLVYGEVLYKANLADRLVADIRNISDCLNVFSDTEMSGSMDILSSAREYAIKKMSDQAAKKGANAIIGIDMESSHASAITHTTIMGTAVIVKKLEQ